MGGRKMSGPEGRLNVAPGPECCCKLKYAICRARFCVALPLTTTASPAVLGPLFPYQLPLFPFPYPFQLSTYYRLTTLCQRSGVKLLKKIADWEKMANRNWLEVVLKSKQVLRHLNSFPFPIFPRTHSNLCGICHIIAFQLHFVHSSQARLLFCFCCSAVNVSYIVPRHQGVCIICTLFTLGLSYSHFMLHFNDTVCLVPPMGKSPHIIDGLHMASSSITNMTYVL